MKKILITVVVLLLFAVTVNAEQLNSKTLDYVKLKIVQNGTLYVTGTVEKANISYYIPQEGVVRLDVVGEGDISWRYAYDNFSNKLVLLEWNKPEGVINYHIDIVVESRAMHTYMDKAIGTNNLYLKETNYIKINGVIRQFAFPFEKSIKRAAELTSLVNQYIDYDLSYVGRNLPSDQVLTEKRGVCVEHANLLAALLRANEIPTRYVVGYAYSSVQDKFIGHTWVEVLTEDGWVPFDPTWLQAGYIDATHVKTAYLLDSSQTDTLTYLGGSINWERSNEQIKMLDYTQKNVTTIKASGTNSVTQNGYGYAKAAVSTEECTLVDITANSCVDNDGTRQFDIQQTNRTVWLCGPDDVYWFFKAYGNNYICPIAIYDQIGGQTEYRVTVGGKGRIPTLFISGPETVLVNEPFTLTASTDGIFYSPDFGLHSSTGWRMGIKKPGSYNFYLYSDGGLYVKTVYVVQQKEFDLSIEAPSTAKLNTLFYVNITVRNLLSNLTPSVTIKYTNQTIKRILPAGIGEEESFTVRLTANKEGLNDVSVSVTGNSLATQSAAISTAQEKSLLDDILGAIAGFFSAIADAIRGMTGG